MFSRSIIKNPFKSKNIAWEGIDFSGKSSQYKMIGEWMRAHYPNVGVVYTKEPGPDRPYGAEIYQILTGTHPTFSFPEMGRAHFQAFYVTDRIHNNRQNILPGFYRGDHIFQDRCMVSSICHGAETFDDFTNLFGIHSRMFDIAGIPLVWPDRILIYDVPVSVALERARKAGTIKDKLEQEEELERARRNYLEFARRYPEACIVIDGRPEEEEIFKRTKEEIVQILGLAA